MATEAEIISRVRLELGDQPEPFRQSYRGTGTQDEFDLPVSRVSSSTLNVYTINGVAITNLVFGQDYTLDPENGVVRLTVAPAQDILIVAEGTAFGMFTDEEIASFVTDATLQHTNERVITVRYVDGHGFTRYDRTPISLVNLPEVENLPLSLLATIEALWALSTDAATDIDITTSEGTHVSRAQRFAQLRVQIDVLTQKYQLLCQQLGLGLFKIETSTLRRVSRTTNRLVPIFVEREYDDSGPIERILPPIDRRDADEDGPPSPATYRGLFG